MKKTTRLRILTILARKRKSKIFTRENPLYLYSVSRPLVDLSELNSALKAGDDISTIKSMCVGKIIPPEAMAELWKVNLMVVHTKNQTT